MQSQVHFPTVSFLSQHVSRVAGDTGTWLAAADGRAELKGAMRHEAVAGSGMGGMTAYVGEEAPEEDSEPIGTFAEYSSLHGLKYITRSHFGLRRRSHLPPFLFFPSLPCPGVTGLSLVWFCLLAVSAAGLAANLREKISDYIKTPIATEISVDYVSRLHLPAILICNTNYFRCPSLPQLPTGAGRGLGARLSESTAKNMYDVVTDVFNDTDYTAVNAHAYPVLRSIDGRQFVHEAAHQLEDMLI